MKCGLCFDGRLTLSCCPMCGRVEGETAKERQERETRTIERASRPPAKTGPFRKWAPPFLVVPAPPAPVKEE